MKILNLSKSFNPTSNFEMRFLKGNLNKALYKLKYNITESTYLLDGESQMELEKKDSSCSSSSIYFLHPMVVKKNSKNPSFLDKYCKKFLKNQHWSKCS